jgi:hypothetical protein
MRTRAKSNADEMVTRQINNEDSLGFWANGASGVNEVDDESEAFKGNVREETAVPRLGIGSIRVSARNRILDTPEVCGVGGSGGAKRYTPSSALHSPGSRCI